MKGCEVGVFGVFFFFCSACAGGMNRDIELEAVTLQRIEERERVC